MGPGEGCINEWVFCSAGCFSSAWQLFAPNSRRAELGEAHLFEDPAAWPGSWRSPSQPAPNPAGNSTLAPHREENQEPFQKPGIWPATDIFQHPERRLMAYMLAASFIQSFQHIWPAEPLATAGTFLGFWLKWEIAPSEPLYLRHESIYLMPTSRRIRRLPGNSPRGPRPVFLYPPAMWKIDDIGKFRVDETEGEGLRFQPGATGRFIHSSGDSGRALVVEDYEGGDGGQDTAWIGYQVQEEGIKPV
jgi:hypothetical protein